MASRRLYRRTLRLAAAAALLAPGPASGASRRPLAELTLEELLDVPVLSVAAQTPQSLRGAAGVVTLITREEIRASGARDLLEALRLVPGLYFGVDVQGMVGAGFRGNWGHEGKILLLVDGQEMNELDYATNQFGGHFPAEHIERIEVVRGPGSALYGGFAELAVISVVTRSADELRGVTAETRVGAVGRGPVDRQLSLEAGGVSESVPGLSASLAGLVGRGRRSDRTYQDFAGARAPLASDSSLDPHWLNAALRYKGTALRVIYDGYRTVFRDGFGTVHDRTKQDFSSYYLEARSDVALGDRLTLTPRVNHKRQYPWRVTDRASSFFAHRSVTRTVGTLSAAFEAGDAVDLLGGVSGTYDEAALADTFRAGLQSTGFAGSDSVSYRALAGFGQVLYRHPLAELAVGGRYEGHSRVPGSFVPRVALTRVGESWDAKLLFAEAYRAPAIQNINLNQNLRPERTTSWEAELGRHLGPAVYLSANVFDVTLRDTIVFTSQLQGGTAVESYYNVDRTGTRGGELTARARGGWGWASAAYSFYTAAGKNRVANYAVPGRSGALLGAAQHRGTLSAGLRAGEKVLLGPSATLLGDRYACGGQDAAKNCLAVRRPAELDLGLFVTVSDAFLPGLELGAGVHNLLDRDIPFLQPYNGGHAALPGPSREVSARAVYTLRFASGANR